MITVLHIAMARIADGIDKCLRGPFLPSIRQSLVLFVCTCD